MCAILFVTQSHISFMCYCSTIVIWIIGES